MDELRRELERLSGRVERFVEEDRAPFIEDTVAAVASAVKGGKRQPDRVREDVRLAVRKIATRWTGKKPIVDVLLIQG